MDGSVTEPAASGRGHGVTSVTDAGSGGNFAAKAGDALAAKRHAAWRLRE
jgi:ATP-dependent protease HslVU (ClpYQ) peptidase subunit